MRAPATAVGGRYSARPSARPPVHTVVKTSAASSAVANVPSGPVRSGYEPESSPVANPDSSASYSYGPEEASSVHSAYSVSNYYDTADSCRYYDTYAGLP